MESVILNQKTEIVYVSLADLEDLQGPLKKTTTQAYKQFKERVLAEGFKYIFFIWTDTAGTHYIIDGHHRKKFLLRMEEEGIEIPASYPALPVTAKNKKEAVKELLFLNSRYGEITHSGIKLLLQQYAIQPLEVQGVRLRATKVSLAKVLVELEDEENSTWDDEKIPDSPPPLTSPGDIWQINGHRILCADARNPDDLERLLGGDAAAMVFTDPPYNVSIRHDIGGDGGTSSIQDFNEFAMASGEMSPEEFTAFLEICLSNLASHSIPASIHYICMDWRHTYELLSAGKAVYTELKNIAVWNKDLPGMGTFYRSKHEFILIFKSGEGKHINNFELGQYGRTRTNVWDFPQINSFQNGTKNPDLYLHPTVKPVRMIYECCLDCSYPGQIVLDSFLGSGSTLIACEKSGRLCYGLEIDAGYCDTSVTRWVSWMQSNGRQITTITRNGANISPDEVFYGE